LLVTSRLVAHLNSTSALHSSQGMTIARKFYLITRIEQAEAPDPNAWRPAAEAEFHSDSSGKGFLSREDAHRAWFELCDLHTEDVSALSYASWLRRKAQQKTTAFSGEGAQILKDAGMRVREWRDDSEIMALASISDADRLELERAAGNGGASPVMKRHLERRVSLPPAEAPAVLTKRYVTKPSKPPKPSKNSTHSKHFKLVEVVARLNWFGAYAAVQVHESEQCKVHARRLLAEMIAEDEKRKRARARRQSGDNKGLLVGRFIANAFIANAVLSRNVEGASRDLISRGPLPSLLRHHDQLVARRSALPPISARTTQRSSSDTLPVSPLRNVLATAR
jgi:hypothetical protein